MISEKFNLVDDRIIHTVTIVVMNGPINNLNKKNRANRIMTTEKEKLFWYQDEAYSSWMNIYNMLLDVCTNVHMMYVHVNPWRMLEYWTLIVQTEFYIFFPSSTFCFPLLANIFVCMSMPMPIRPPGSCSRFIK